MIPKGCTLSSELRLRWGPWLVQNLVVGCWSWRGNTPAGGCWCWTYQWFRLRRRGSFLWMMCKKLMWLLIIEILLHCFMLSVWIQQRVLHITSRCHHKMTREVSELRLVFYWVGLFEGILQWHTPSCQSCKFRGIVLNHWYQLLMVSVWLQWTAVWHLFYSLCTYTYMPSIQHFDFVIYNYK